MCEPNFSCFASTINDLKVKHTHVHTIISLFLSHASFLPSRQLLPSNPAVQFTIAHVSLLALCVTGSRVCMCVCASVCACVLQSSLSAQLSLRSSSGLLPSFLQAPEPVYQSGVHFDEIASGTLWSSKSLRVICYEAILTLFRNSDKTVEEKL